MPTCNKCGEPIEFVRLPSGRFLPVDIEPSMQGRVKLEGPQDASGIQEAHILRDSEYLGLTTRVGLRVNHFDTCEGK